MSSSYFRFKQFTVWHDQCAMKVGTDGVLLGALASPKTGLRFLDVGTGSGLIAMMLAQRFPKARIDAIDIDEDAINQAKTNIDKSIFANRIEVSLRDFCEMRSSLTMYDLIVSNPPFYTENTSCPDRQRDIARHADSLPFATLARNASEMLSENGVFTVVIPTQNASDFIQECSYCGMFLSERTDIQTTPRKDVKRCILAFTKKCSNNSKISTLMMRTEYGDWSEEYKQLTKDFYLNL